MIIFVPEFKKLLESHARWVTVPANTRLCEQGQNADYVYVASQNSLEIRLFSGRLYEEVIVDFVQPGDSYFLLDCLHSKQYPASLYCPQETDVLKVPIQTARDIIKNEPEIFKKLTLIAQNVGFKKFIKNKLLSILNLKSEAFNIHELFRLNPTLVQIQSGSSYTKQKGIHVLNSGKINIKKSSEQNEMTFTLNPGDYFVIDEGNSQKFEIEVLEEATLMKLDLQTSEYVHYILYDWKIQNPEDQQNNQSSNQIEPIKTKYLSPIRSWFKNSKIENLRTSQNPEDHEFLKLYSALTLLGSDIQIDDSRKLYQLFEDQDFSPNTLATLFELHGHNVEFFENINELSQNSILIGINNKEIVLILNCNEQDCFIFKPHKGVSKISWKNLFPHKNVKLMLVTPTPGIRELIDPNQDQKLNELSIKKFLFQNLQKYKNLFFNLLGLAGILGLISSTKGIVFQNTISQLSYTQDIGIIKVFGYSLIALGFFYFMINSLFTLLSQYLKTKVAHQIKMTLLKNSFFSFQNDKSVEQSHSFLKWLGSFDQLTTQLIHHPVQLLKSFSSLLIMLLFLATISFKYFAIYLVFIIVAVAYILRFVQTSQQYLAKISSQSTSSQNLKFSDFSYVLLNIENKNQMPHFKNRTETGIFENKTYTEKMKNQQSKILLTIKIIGLLFFSVIYYFSITESFENPQAAAIISGLLIYLGYISSESAQLFQSLISYSTWNDNFSKMRTLLSPNEIYQKLKTNYIFTRLRGKIKFEQVSFKYPDNASPSVIQTSITMQKGEFIMIVGKSGSGKSTFAKLITQEIQPGQGKIFYDEIESKFLSPSIIRSQISFVERKPRFFSGKVIDNITVNKAVNSWKLDHICQLSKISNCTENLQDFLATQLDDENSHLSSGQAQLIGIAQALYQNTKILILDEATCYLDSKTESEIIENIKKDKNQKTIILITHQLSLAKYADKIIVFKDGFIAESGTHDQLLKAGKEYAELYRSQGGLD